MQIVREVRVRLIGIFAGALVLLAFAWAAPADPQIFETNEGKIRVVTLADGLANPWSLAFLPNGDMLVTEKPGRLRVIRNGQLESTPISGTPTVHTNRQAGLMDVILHPNFATNNLVYLTYSKAGQGGATTALMRARLDGNRLVDGRDIFVADAWADTDLHFGSRLVFGRDGMIYMTVGERNQRERAQRTTDHAGKVLRLRDDGTVPPDNPFVGRAGFKPEIYSYGHRNLQGLAIHPETGTVWANEHGPLGGDEVNVIQAGRNYGWPVITYGKEYNGELIAQSWREGMEQPRFFWVPAIGISGMAFYTGDRFPTWRNHVFVGGLSQMLVCRVRLQGQGALERESLLTQIRHRIRDVRQGPDGLLYVVTDGTFSRTGATGTVLRIEPAS
jgi:glucose/arabinose dehydrogenase